MHNFLSAPQAIETSEQEDRIVHCRASSTCRTILLAECDDSVATHDVDGKPVTEYWADSWRVHVHD